jgi:DNA-binding LacI/PurR family transcriptional regulator
MPEHVRMKDIAARAKVSVATVSLALRDSALISPATRARLIALADEMGYQAHPYVSAYMSWRRNRGSLHHPSIALLHPYPTTDGWRKHGSASLREMHHGVTTQIRTHGYAAQEFRLGTERPRRLVEILRARGITGLVFAPVAEKTQRYDFPWEEFSAVQLGTGPAGVELPRVAHHHYHGALHAVRRCAEQGCRRPGLVLDRAHDERLGHVWRAGFEMGAEGCGFARNAVWLMSEQRPDLRSLRAWLKLKKPDVIVTNLHEVLERLLGNLGLRVPDDVRLVSLSVPAIGDRITGIEQNSALIGTRAIDLLAGALQLHRTGLLPEAITTLVNGRWNIGATL